MCWGGLFIQAGGSLSGVITNSDASRSAMILEFVAATISSERWEVAEFQMHMNVCLAMATNRPAINLYPFCYVTMTLSINS